MANQNPLMEEARGLAEGKWKKYMQGVTEGYKRAHNGQSPDPSIIGTTALMLENTQRMIQRMDETTKVVNLGNFVDYGFGVITAVMPALVANEIVSVQPLKARTGEIFYLDFKYGSNKGNIHAGDTMISAQTSATDDTEYSSQNVGGEEVGRLVSGTTTYEFFLSYTPAAAGSVKLSAGSFDITDNGDGTLTGGTGSNLTSGTIDYATGKIDLTFSAVSADATLAGSYSFQYGNMDVDGNIPQVDVDLTSSTISSVTRSLRARWMFDAAFEMLQVHGINSDDEIAKAMAAEIRHEIDGEIMNDLYNQAQAGGSMFAWSKTPGTGVSYKDHKDTFVDTLNLMSNAIFKDTLRGTGNFIVAGINAASIIQTLDSFEASSDAIKPGPHVIGKLKGQWKVIIDPYYGNDDFLVGYKGSSYLEGGYVYAPFLPLYTTPTMMLDDFVNRKGCRTIYGKKCLNPHFYAKGRIVA